MAQGPLTYAAAGVDLQAAESATNRIRDLAEQTFNPSVLAGIGSFGAAYSLAGRELRSPVLVSSADGVGTKLKIAFAANRHDTIGQCLVNHCVNDIAVQGADPLFFLDYLASGRLKPDVTEHILRGIAWACKENGVALIGGETAEMPGLYQVGEYDLAGFIVGIAERAELLPGPAVELGSELVALPSSGLHTNGYSLARKVFLDVAQYRLDQWVPELNACLGAELLKMHRSYLKPLRVLRGEGLLLAAAHITGGGIPENTPRMLAKQPGLHPVIRIGSWHPPPVFRHLQEVGKISDTEMRRTFNLGVGLIACVPAGRSRAALDALEEAGERAFRIGHVEAGPGGVEFAP